jgi:hydrogenase expression/formation protein HypC
MCLGIPGQIVTLSADHPDLATVDVSGVMRTVNIALLEPGSVGPGDWVLIHVGFAMAKMDEAEARTSLAFLESMGAAFTDEVDAWQRSPGGD